MSAIYIVDLDTLTDPETYTVNFSSEMCKETANRLKIHHFHKVALELHVAAENHYWIMSGHIAAQAQLKCVKSGELFDENFNVPFNVILSHLDIDDENLDVEILESQKFDAGDIAVQYLALSIPLAPLHPRIIESSSNGSMPSLEDEIPAWKKALAQIVDKK